MKTYCNYDGVVSIPKGGIFCHFCGEKTVKITESLIGEIVKKRDERNENLRNLCEQMDKIERNRESLTKEIRTFNTLINKMKGV